MTASASASASAQKPSPAQTAKPAPSAAPKPAGGALRFRVLTPVRSVVDMFASSVAVETVAGALEILPGFEPTISPLAVGLMKAERDNGSVVTLAVHGGYMDMNGKVLVVLADSAEIGTDIDAARAREAVARARARLERFTSDSRPGGEGEAGVDPDRARQALLRGLNRLRATGAEA